MRSRRHAVQQDGDHGQEEGRQADALHQQRQGEVQEAGIGGEVGAHQIGNAEGDEGQGGDHAGVDPPISRAEVGVSSTAITPAGAATSPAQVAV